MDAATLGASATDPPTAGVPQEEPAVAAGSDVLMTTPVAGTVIVLLIGNCTDAWGATVQLDGTLCHPSLLANGGMLSPLLRQPGAGTVTDVLPLAMRIGVTTCLTVEGGAPIVANRRTGV
mmetsp:Transcript_60972/g.108354  ORF Transcript_60972/g.108354 Transcript_60972/m.108354 type:complete len:120 (+) Transcript_60972:198-557(+)